MPPHTDSDGVCSDTGPTVTGGRVTPSATAGLLDSSTDVTTIGMKRTAVGQIGRPLTIWTNHFDVQLHKHEIYHYHGAFHPDRLVLSTDTFNLSVMVMTSSRCVFLVLPTPISLLT